MTKMKIAQLNVQSFVTNSNFLNTSTIKGGSDEIAPTNSADAISGPSEVPGCNTSTQTNISRGTD